MPFKICDCDKLLSITPVTQFWLQAVTWSSKPHYTRWLIKNAKKCEKLSRFLVGMENFTLKEICVARRNVGQKIVPFLCSVVYYFGDLLKSANRAFVRKETFISLRFDCFLSLSHSSQEGNCDRRGDPRVTCRVLVDVQVPCATTSAFPDRGWRETFPPHLKGNINSLMKFINCAMFPENKIRKCCFLFPPSRNSTQK